MKRQLILSGLMIAVGQSAPAFSDEHDRVPMLKNIRAFAILLVGLVAWFGLSAAQAKEVNLYSAQKEHLIRPMLDAFEQETGIKVNMITGDQAALVARLEQEGENTPADLLLTVDIGNIYQAKAKGLLQTADSEVLKAQIPDYLRDPDGQWVGLTIRSRVIFYNKDKISPEEISTYEALADTKWRNALLIRSSSNVYNQSLVAAMLAHHGEEKTKEWLKGLVANFARPPQGGDTDQLKELAAGEGKIAVANTYYYGRLIAGVEDIEGGLVKEKVGIIFPNQDGRGAHVNIRGGGVTKHAKNKENAIKLLEFLASDKAQSFFAENNFEYPAKPGVAVPNVLESWGELKRDTINLESVGEHQAQAIMLMDEAGWQ